MKLRRMLKSQIKTTASRSLSVGLAVTMALGPTLSYASTDGAASPSDTTTSDNSPNAKTSVSMQSPQKLKQLTAVEWALNGTAQTQQNNFQLAMKLLAQGKTEEAKKYLLNGISASSKANLLNADINSQVFGAVKSNAVWMAEAGLTTSKISDAVAQANQQLPPVKNLPVVTTTPDTSDYPGIFATPTINGIYPGDEQVKKLGDLMSTNPELRTLLWQTAQQRLGVIAPDLGVNPPAYTATNSVLPSSALCNLYSPLCAFMSGGGILNVDYSQEMQNLKNKNFGIPLDELADQIITKQVYVATGIGLVARLLKDIPGSQGPVTGTWIGQTAVDISPSLALYYTTYMMVGELAGLYNYPLNTGNKESLALVALALAKVVTPTIYYGGKNLKTRKATSAAIVTNPIMKLVGKTVAFARNHNQTLDKAFASLGTRYPDIGRALSESIKSYGVVIPTAKLNEEERTKQAKNLSDPANPNPEFPNGEPTTTTPPGIPGPDVPPGGTGFPPGGSNFPPGGSDFPPGEPPPTDTPPKQPENPHGKQSVAVQIAWIIAATAGNTVYNYTEAEILGQVVKALFKNAYEEDRRLESEKFRKYLLSSANTKFLKLLILSQSPDSLQLNPSNTPVTFPPVTFPPLTPTTTNPATIPPGTVSPPGTIIPAKVDAKPTTPDANPNKQYFPFAATSNKTSTTSVTKHFGGEPYKFILNLARNMKICSAKNIEDASTAVAPVTALIEKLPALGKYDLWTEKENKAKRGVVSAMLQPVAKLIPFYKNSGMRENLFDELKSGRVTQADVGSILLIHDCYGRSDTDRFTDVLNEMISFSNFSDADIGVLRMADPFIRLRMAETILQLMYLNGEPDQKGIAYFDRVQKILALDSTAYNQYFGFYQAELKTAMYVPYTFSPTGYRLRNLSAQNPYDVTIMDEKRPDEPQAMTPVSKVSPNGSSGIGSWGNVSNSTPDPFIPGGQSNNGGFTGF